MRRTTAFALLTSTLLTGLAACGNATEAPAPVGPEHAAFASDRDAIRELIDERGVVTVLVQGPKGLRDPEAIAAWQQDLVREIGVDRVVREYTRLPALAVAADAHTLEVLNRSRHVTTVELSISRPAQFAETATAPDGGFDDWHVEQVGADRTRRHDARGEGQTVVIIDTGIDLTHPLLRDSVTGGACFSTHTRWSTSLCPDAAPTAFGRDAGATCEATALGCEHGTHVAGIAGAAIAPDADLVSMMVFTEITDCSLIGGPAGPCLVATDADVLAALDHVLRMAEDHPVAAVNMSLGGGAFADDCTTDLRAGTIAALRDAGVAVVVASGNESLADEVAMPACVPEAITVGATDANDEVTYFSNGGPQVDLLAPGQGILSTLPGTAGYLDGTSMACPHVAGAVAVLRGLDPTLTVDEIEDILKGSGTDVTDLRNGRTTPRLQLDAAAIEVLER